MALNQQQKDEIKRLSSLLATARVLRYRNAIGTYRQATQSQCAARLAKATKNLADYLDSL